MKCLRHRSKWNQCKKEGGEENRLPRFEKVRQNRKEGESMNNERALHQQPDFFF